MVISQGGYSAPHTVNPVMSSHGSTDECAWTVPKSSTIEVHPNFLRLPTKELHITYHPKTDFGKDNFIIPTNNPIAQEYTITSSDGRVLVFRRVWAKEPRHSGRIFSEMCYLYRKSRPPRCTCVSQPLFSSGFHSILLQQQSGRSARPYFILRGKRFVSVF